MIARAALLAALFGLWSLSLPAMAGPAEDAAAAYAAGDYAGARELWRSLAEQGASDAQFRMGLLYERGEGVPKNDRDAAAWYGMAAGRLPEAQARLGQFYREGRGVDKNATRAALLLYGATMAGHGQAMKDLAAMARKNAPKASLFGVNLARAERGALRAALKRAAVLPVREDDDYICDVYDVRKAVPGAVEMAACYGPAEQAAGKNEAGTGADRQLLGFVKIDYTAADRVQAGRISAMTRGRFGEPSAGEGADAAMWNLGDVIVATQYAPQAGQVGLMYMVPRVYHLTRRPERPEAP